MYILFNLMRCHDHCWCNVVVHLYLINVYISLCDTNIVSLLLVLLDIIDGSIVSKEFDEQLVEVILINILIACGFAECVVGSMSTCVSAKTRFD